MKYEVVIAMIWFDEGKLGKKLAKTTIWNRR